MINYSIDVYYLVHYRFRVIVKHENIQKITFLHTLIQLFKITKLFQLVEYGT